MSEELQDLARARSAGDGGDRRARAAVPRYRAMYWAGRVLMVVGVLVAIAGLVCGAMPAMGMAAAAARGSGGEWPMVIFVGVLGVAGGGIAGGIAGMIVAGCGQLLICIRDVGRNSFR